MSIIVERNKMKIDNNSHNQLSTKEIELRDNAKANDVTTIKILHAFWK